MTARDFNSFSSNIKSVLSTPFKPKGFIFLAGHAEGQFMPLFWERQWYFKVGQKTLDFFNYRIPSLSFLEPKEKDTYPTFNAVIGIFPHKPNEGFHRHRKQLKFSLLSRDHPHQTKTQLKLGHSLSPFLSANSLPNGSDDQHTIQEESLALWAPDPHIHHAVLSYLGNTRLKYLGAVTSDRIKMQRHCHLFTHQLKSNGPFFKKCLKMKCSGCSTW